MDKELFRKTEGKLYRYFKLKNTSEALKENISWLESKIKEVERDIKTTNVTIDYYQSGIGINERVQSSSTGTSYAEAEIIKEITKLEREHCNMVKRLLKCKAKLREVEEFTKHMDYNIKSLNEEDKRFLELKYGECANILKISRLMNMAQTTAYRKREELIENIANFDILVKK